MNESMSCWQAVGTKAVGIRAVGARAGGCRGHMFAGAADGTLAVVVVVGGSHTAAVHMKVVGNAAGHNLHRIPHHHLACTR